MYHKTVLENGVKILSERMEHIRSISLGIWVGAGSRDEMEGENGISHFVEHMIFKGTRSRSGIQIAKELDAIGGLSNAFTGKEHTCYHSKVLDKHLSTLAEILSDIFLNSIFDSRDMDRERQVILQEINMMEDTPEDRIHVLFNRLCWIDHPLGMCVLGTDETVSNIRKKTILDYISRFYTPSRIIITAAGNIEHDALVAHFEPLFKSIRTGNESPSRRIPNVHSDISSLWKDLEQVHICLGGKAPNLSSDARFAGAVLNTILGGNMSSRLFQEIREKRGLAYSLYSFLSSYMDAGLMGVYVGTEPSQVNQVLEVVNREIRKIRDGDISESDILAAREHLIGGVLLGSENTDVRMMRLAKNDYVFGRYVSYDELMAKLEEVTVDHVVAVAQDTFQNDEVSLVTLGPKRREEIDSACLQFN